jgi:hypothetical protein
MSEGQASNLDILCTNGEEIYQQWDIQFLHKLDTICMSCESDSDQKQNVRIELDLTKRAQQAQQDSFQGMTSSHGEKFAPVHTHYKNFQHPHLSNW